MKTIKWALISLILIIGNFAQATVRTVDNRLGAPNNVQQKNYGDLQVAITASAAGDTIYIQGSGIVYNQTYTPNRPIVIIGPGHNPAVQNPLTAQVASFDVSAGASSSIFIGLSFTGKLTFRNAANNIMVQRCKFATAASGIFKLADGCNISGWIVEGCVFTSKSNYAFNNEHGYTDNTRFRNNIFNSPIQYVWTESGQLNYISHNVFINTNGAALSFFKNCVVDNNIFYASNPGEFVNQGNVSMNNNISFACTDGRFQTTSQSGNLTNSPPQFANYSGGDFSYAQDFHLLETSPGRNTGSDGTDRGVYGGNTMIFSMTGESLLPQVTALTNNGSSTLPQNGTLNITLSGRTIQ